MPRPTNPATLLRRPFTPIASRDFQADLDRMAGAVGIPGPGAATDATQEAVGNAGTAAIQGGAPPSLGRAGSALTITIPAFQRMNSAGRPYGISVPDRFIQKGDNVTRQALVTDLTQALQELGLVVRVSSARRHGNSIGAGNRSRHNRAEALDLDLVNGVSATLQNGNAVLLVRWLMAHGYVAGVESGSPRALLFGPTGSTWNRTQFDHTTHIHISNTGAA